MRLFLVLLLYSFALAVSATSQLRTDDDAAESMALDLQKKLKGTKIGDPARYRDLFAPLRTEMTALSPDGKHLAYPVRIDDDIYVQIVAIDEPTVIKTRALIHRVERPPINPAHIELGLVDWLCWVTPTRLVIASTAVSRKGRASYTGVVSGIDVDGSNARVLATPDRFTEVIYSKPRNPGLLWAVGPYPGRADSIIFVANTLVFAPGEDRRLLVPWLLDVFTEDSAKLGEAFTRIDTFQLLDDRGRARVTVPTPRHAKDFNSPILYQSGSEAESSIPLDQVTGLRGFAFSTTAALGEGSVPLGFDDPGDTLYYASNMGRDAYGIYAIDLKTRQLLPDTLERPGCDLLSPQLGTFDSAEYFGIRDRTLNDLLLMRWPASPQLVMDRFNHKLAGVRYDAATRTAAWFRPELLAVQERLARERPGRSAEILEWDKSLNRFLVREQGPSDAGAFFVLDLQKDTYTNFVRRGPEPETGSIAELTPYDFKLPDGSRIEGLIALPKDSKTRKIPLVLLCPDFPWQRRGTSYQPEFEALTRMGFAVAIYNGRGAWGTGIKERQKLQGDYVAIQTADVVAVADHLAAKFENVSRRSVALYGEGHGGYVALRTLQLYPQRFRAAVTADAWIQGNAFFDAIVQAKPLTGSSEKATRPTSTPLTDRPELIKAPVFTIVEFSESPRYHANTALHRAVKRNAPDSELFVQTDKLAERPEVLARQWARTESFLNYVLYNFSVKIGELEVLSDEAKAKQP